MSKFQTVSCLFVVLIANGSVDAGWLDLDFSTRPAESSVSLGGTASWRSTGGSESTGYVSLTDVLNNQLGAIVLPDLDAGAPVQRFSIDAWIRMGGGSAAPADGMSFNFVRPNDPLLSSRGLSGWASNASGELNLPEEGATTGLAIAFDEWGSGNGDVMGISVRVDDQLITQVSMPEFHGSASNAASLQTGPAGLSVNDLGALEWVPLRISLDDGRLRVSYKSQLIVDQAVDFVTSPGQVVIGGRTGGSTSYHHLDHLTVSTQGPLPLGRISVADQPISINTLSSSLNINTEIGLFDSSGQLLTTNDDANNSSLSEIRASLTSGSYYLALGPFNTTFDDGFRVRPGSSTGGNYHLDVGPTRTSGQLQTNGVDWFSFDVTAPVSPPPSPIAEDIAIPDRLQNEVGRRAYVARSVENPANGTVYHLVRGFERSEDLRITTELRFDGAQSIAKILGGHLVNISDRNEDEFLREAFPGDPDTGLDYKFWINLTRSDHEQLQWANGEPLTYTNWFTDEPNGDLAYVLNYSEVDYQWYTAVNDFSLEPGISAIVEVPRNARLVVPLNQLVFVETPPPTGSFSGDDDDVPAHWNGLQLIPYADQDGQPITAGGNADFSAKTMMELDLAAAIGEETWAQVPSDSVLTFRFRGYISSDRDQSFSIDGIRATLSAKDGESASDQQFLGRLLLTNGCEWDFVLSYPLVDLVDFEDLDSSIVEIELEYFDGDTANIFYDFSTSNVCTTSPPTGMEQGGVELREISLSTPSFPRGDLNGDLAATAADIDYLAAQIRVGAEDGLLDLDSDGVLGFGDLQVLVHDLMGTYFGDANLDGMFDTKDLIGTMAAGEYEDEIVNNSGWSTGDWNGDGEFSSSDLVVALADGGFERGPRFSSPAVPEPSGALAISLGILLISVTRRRTAPRSISG